MISTKLNDKILAGMRTGNICKNRQFSSAERHKVFVKEMNAIQDKRESAQQKYSEIVKQRIEQHGRRNLVHKLNAGHTRESL